MKAAIVVGHDKISPGAYSSCLHASEYIYNSEVATYLAGVADIYKRPLVGGYKTQMKKLASEINKKDYDIVIELHFNMFNKRANGCETVSFPGSKSLEFGRDFCEKITECYMTDNRGAKEAKINGRGWWFLALMEAPAIILEPFFGDHEESLKFENPGMYASVIKQMILN
jgi:N-acetylmuramoyl-L-alanine amidase